MASTMFLTRGRFLVCWARAVVIHVVEQGPQDAKRSRAFAICSRAEQIEDLTGQVALALAQLEALEQCGDRELKSVAELDQCVETRRERCMLEPADRVGRKPATLGELLLRQATGFAKPLNVLAEPLRSEWRSGSSTHATKMASPHHREQVRSERLSNQTCSVRVLLALSAATC
jgi:hypothetical protein